MKRVEVARIKQLLRDTFWQFEGEHDCDITPALVRNFVRHQVKCLPDDLVELTGIYVKGGDFWHRAEKLCRLIEVSKKFNI